MKYFISLLFFIFSVSSLLSMGTKNKTALKKINEIFINDKNERTVALLPFNNLSNNKFYDFIGYTAQKYLLNNLVLLDKIYITTNDVKTPTIKSNMNNVVFKYGTNFVRKVIFYSLTEINRQLITFPFSDDLKKFASVLKVDYLITGNYRMIKDNTFSLDVYVYNYIRDKKFKIGNFIIYKNSLDNDMKFIADKIFLFFNRKYTGYLKIITSLSNINIFIDNNFIVNNKKLFLLNNGEHKLFITSEDNINIAKKIFISAGKTNYLILTNDKNITKKKIILNINTIPTNANLFLNVDYLGKTPVSVSNLDAGKYRLKVTKKNYQTYFNNINITKSTNLYISLKKIIINNNYNFYKKLSYITLGVGVGSLLASYYFYTQRDIYWDKYFVTKNIDYLNKGNSYSIASGVSLIIGGVSLGISLYSFFKVINYDDKNIGFNIYDKKIYLANNFMKHTLQFTMRF